MPRSRSRSRGRDWKKEDWKKDSKDDRDDRPSLLDKSRQASGGGSIGPASSTAPKAANSEQEIVAVAIKQLPAEIRDRLEKLFEEGLLKDGDLDLRSVTVFASLNEGLQTRVMNHMENERIYVANARSKSGFLIATCDKAKTGCLDARGLGAIDPWRTALVAMATPKQKLFDLKAESDWLDTHDEAVLKFHVNLDKFQDDLGTPTVTVELPPTETMGAVTQKLVAMGLKSIPANRMKLHADSVGFLKERNSFAFYNLEGGTTLTLSGRKRAGRHLRKDHSVMPKRPKPPPETPAPVKAATPVAFPSLPNVTLPKLPGGLPGLPGLSALPGLGGTGSAPALPGLSASMPGLSLPGLGSTGPGGLNFAALGGAGKAGGMAFPGLPPLGADPKAAALAMMASMTGGKAGGLALPSGGTGHGLDLSGGTPPMSKAQAPTMPGMPGKFGGMPGMPPGLSLPTATLGGTGAVAKGAVPKMGPMA